MKPPDPPASLKSLWSQFLPLSLSDVTMALCDPLVSTTLAHMPEARTNLAAIGVAKSQAIFFESPIIMLLHAANALAPRPAARRALFHFTAAVTLALTAGLALLCLPPVFAPVSARFLGVDGAVASAAHRTLMILVPWPLAIGWRRFYQGLLIHGGFGREIGKASLSRAWLLAFLLAAGWWLGVPGELLAGFALMAGIFCELAFVLAAARHHGLMSVPAPGAAWEAEAAEETVSMGRILHFYWPLANSMLVVWGARALLVGIVARAVDGPVALAAWPAAWGLVLLVANSTRMVQQVSIRNRAHTPVRTLVMFALSVGSACSAILTAVAFGPLSTQLVSAFFGGDAVVAGAAFPVLAASALTPLMVALLNLAQGLLIREERTGWVNGATWIGSLTLLGLAQLGVWNHMPGASAAALAMTSAITVELFCLGAGFWHWTPRFWARV